jgi:hypothetical protein
VQARYESLGGVHRMLYRTAHSRTAGRGSAAER